VCVCVCEREREKVREYASKRRLSFDFSFLLVG